MIIGDSSFVVVGPKVNWTEAGFEPWAAQLQELQIWEIPDIIVLFPVCEHVTINTNPTKKVNKFPVQVSVFMWKET